MVYDDYMEQPMLTRHQLAERLQLGIATIDRLRSDGTGPRHVKIGKSVRYRIVDIERWERNLKSE